VRGNSIHVYYGNCTIVQLRDGASTKDGARQPYLKLKSPKLIRQGVDTVPGFMVRYLCSRRE
jgi:hypothetical protein